MPERSNHASLPLLSGQLSQLHSEDNVTMVSSVEVPPIITSSAEPSDGGADFINQYLNEDAMSSGQPSSSPMPSSRGLTPSSEGRQRSSTNASQNGGNHNENRNLDDSKGASDGLKNHRASRAGARSVSKLTPQQLARKRANDREAQRAIRQRTKEHIDNLEREIQELKSHTPEWAVRQRNQELEELVQILKQQLVAERMEKARLMEATGQAMPMGMSAEAQNMSDMNWPALSQPYDPEAMTAFNPPPIGVSQPGDVTGPGNDILQQYANVNQGLMTPYTSAASTTGNFPDLNNSALNYGTLPVQDNLLGLPGDMATPTWTTAMNPSFPMGDPNMLSPPNRYLNSEEVPYPYDTKPPTIQSQPSNPLQQLQPPSIQPGPDGPPNIKYELSPTAMPSQPQQVQTPQPMRQLTSSLPTPPEQEIERRRMQQQQEQQHHQGPHPHQRPLQPNLQPNIQPNNQNPPRMQPPQQQNHPQQQRQRASSLHQKAGGIPIAPAPPHPPPPAHLQRRQPSSQNIQPIPQEQQMQLKRHRQQQQQQQQQMQQARMQQHQQRQLSPRNPQQQMQPNMPQQTQQVQQLPNQPSIPYWAQTPTFIPPTCTIDSLLHSALAQHRASVRAGGTNHRAPDYSTLLSLSTTSSSGPCPLAPAQSDPSPLSSAISRAIHVAGFRGLATQAAVLYTTHCLLRWQADPQPETYAHIPDWLRPGRMQLTMPHALWVSQLVWRPLREWVATQGGRYVQDDFILSYARNLKIDWEGMGRSLTGGSSPGRKGSREKAFESGVFEVSSTGEVVMTGKFEQAVRELGNWGMRREFLANYPELGECVRRARDSFSS